MPEEHFIHLIRTMRSTSRETPRSVFAVLDSAFSAHSCSQELWCIRGDCIQLGGDDSPFELREALSAYERALELDPGYTRAHESLGYYFDVVELDLARAEAAFLTAVQRGGGPRSYAGLGRVLAERGRSRAEVIALLEGCPFRDSPLIAESLAEAKQGEWEPERISSKPAKTARS